MNKATREFLVLNQRLNRVRKNLAITDESPYVVEIVKTDMSVQRQVSEMFQILDRMNTLKTVRR